MRRKNHVDHILFIGLVCLKWKDTVLFVECFRIGSERCYNGHAVHPLRQHVYVARVIRDVPHAFEVDKCPVPPVILVQTRVYFSLGKKKSRKRRRKKHLLTKIDMHVGGGVAKCTVCQVQHLATPYPQMHCLPGSPPPLRLLQYLVGTLVPYTCQNSQFCPVGSIFCCISPPEKKLVQVCPLRIFFGAYLLHWGTNVFTLSVVLASPRPFCLSLIEQPTSRWRQGGNKVCQLSSIGCSANSPVATNEMRVWFSVCGLSLAARYLREHSG